MHLKKLFVETTPVMQDLGTFLKKLSAQSMEEKKLLSAKSMVDKNFLLPRNNDLLAKNNGPSLTGNENCYFEGEQVSQCAC